MTNQGPYDLTVIENVCQLTWDQDKHSFKYLDKTNKQEGFCPSNDPADYITRTKGVA